MRSKDRDVSVVKAMNAHPSMTTGEMIKLQYFLGTHSDNVPPNMVPTMRPKTRRLPVNEVDEPKVRNGNRVSAALPIHDCNSTLIR